MAVRRGTDILPRSGLLEPKLPPDRAGQGVFSIEVFWRAAGEALVMRSCAALHFDLDVPDYLTYTNLTLP